MKVNPVNAAAALLLAGVTTFATTAVVQHRRERARARAAPPPLEDEDLLPAPRHIYLNGPPPAPIPAPSPAADDEPPRGELHLHVTGPHGLVFTAFDVVIHRRGDEPDDWTQADSDDDEESSPGAFAVSDLEPGRYDVRVEAVGMRTVTLDDVPTGPKIVEVALARRPALLGAVGDLGGPGCAGTTIAWSGPEPDVETGEASLDDDCTFYVEALPEEGPVTVVARRGAVEARALVSPPLSGDAAFLCLAPPCFAEPASLLVYVTDTEHQQVDDASLSWTWQSELAGALGTSEGMGVIFVHGRRAGQTLALRAVRGDHVAETTTLLGAGVTEAVLTLPSEPSSYDRDTDDEGDTDVDDTVEASTPVSHERVIIRH